VANLYAHKLRSLLTMLGMIFGVARWWPCSPSPRRAKEMMSFIDQLGVNNIIVEAHEAADRNELQTVRRFSRAEFPRLPGHLGKRTGLVAITPRKRFKPQKLLPKTSQEPPQLIGVLPNFVEINSLKLVDGRFFTAEENRLGAVCVLANPPK